MPGGAAETRPLAEPIVVTPPADEGELLDRARGLAGFTIGELSLRAGLECPENQKRKKGYVGRLIERLLGASAGSAAEPDFPTLGVELKTIPVDARGKPRETTFVCRISLNELPETEWEDSVVAKKLARVLFMPVEADKAVPLPHRRVGAPILWSPAAVETDALQRDWERIALMVARGDAAEITAHLGDVMQVRPKAANNRERTRAPEHDGAYILTGPRGFYLRTQFTARIIARGLG